MRTLMAPNPDFFLDPTDGGNQRDLGSPEAEVRACWVQGRLRNSGRDDFALVLIEPPLIGQPYGLGDRDIDRVLLATRHAGRTLFPVTEWPALVYVIRVLDERVGYYHGGDVLYELEGVPGVWHEVCLRKAGTGP